MAREDTRWFIAAVVILSLVLFLALPLSLLLVVDHMKLQAELKGELREVRRLKKDLSTARSNRERPDSNVAEQAKGKTD